MSTTDPIFMRADSFYKATSLIAAEPSNTNPDHARYKQNAPGIFKTFEKSYRTAETLHQKDRLLKGLYEELSNETAIDFNISRKKARSWLRIAENLVNCKEHNAIEQRFSTGSDTESESESESESDPSNTAETETYSVSETPMTSISKNLLIEWLSILSDDTTKHKPWFESLPQWEKTALKNIVKNNLYIDSKNLGDFLRDEHLKVGQLIDKIEKAAKPIHTVLKKFTLASTVRRYPGAANNYTHTLKEGGKTLSKRIRIAVPLPFDAKGGPDEQQRLTYQALRDTIITQLAEHLCANPPATTEKIIYIPILIQSLLTPIRGGFDSNSKMLAAEKIAIDRLNNEMCNKAEGPRFFNEVKAIAEIKLNNKLVIMAPLVHSNRAINTHKTKSYSFLAPLLVKNRISTQPRSEASLINFLNTLIKQDKKTYLPLKTCYQKLIRSNRSDDQTYLAALESLIVEMSKGINITHCKSSKDRAGYQGIFTDAFISFYHKHQELPRLYRERDVAGRGKSRKDFLEFLANTYKTETHQKIASNSAPGVNGLLHGHNILMPDEQRAIYLAIHPCADADELKKATRNYFKGQHRLGKRNKIKISLFRKVVNSIKRLFSFTNDPSVIQTASEIETVDPDALQTNHSTFSPEATGSITDSITDSTKTLPPEHAGAAQTENLSGPVDKNTSEAECGAKPKSLELLS